ncbi:MAG: hypothetical protein F082_8 [bacterium F082]|jgi:hypothetical protein|nr:MAG: hypothetical protein F082_8 [bacterium F082]KWW31759.1 MAG: hypothetical protein AUK64_8 [bacterium P201]
MNNNVQNLGCKYKHFEKNYAIKWQFFVQMELYAKAVPRESESHFVIFLSV